MTESLIALNIILLWIFVIIGQYFHYKNFQSHIDMLKYDKAAAEYIKVILQYLNKVGND